MPRMPTDIRSQSLLTLVDIFSFDQFLHSDDCAAALGALLRPAGFAQLPFSLDLSNGVWVTLRSLAEQVQTIGLQMTGQQCDVHFSDKKVCKNLKLCLILHCVLTSDNIQCKSI